MIRKEGNKYKIYSHKGKVLGSYGSKAAAVKRLGQIEFFKHQHGKNETAPSAEPELFPSGSDVNPENLTFGTDEAEKYFRSTPNKGWDKTTSADTRSGKNTTTGEPQENETVQLGAFTTVPDARYHTTKDKYYAHYDIGGQHMFVPYEKVNVEAYGPAYENEGFRLASSDEVKKSLFDLKNLFTKTNVRNWFKKPAMPYSSEVIRPGGTETGIHGKVEDLYDYMDEHLKPLGFTRQQEDGQRASWSSDKGMIAHHGDADWSFSNEKNGTLKIAHDDPKFMEALHKFFEVEPHGKFDSRKEVEEYLHGHGFTPNVLPFGSSELGGSTHTYWRHELAPRLAIFTGDKALSITSWKSSTLDPNNYKVEGHEDSKHEYGDERLPDSFQYHMSRGLQRKPFTVINDNLGDLGHGKFVDDIGWIGLGKEYSSAKSGRFKISGKNCGKCAYMHGKSQDGHGYHGRNPSNKPDVKKELLETRDGYKVMQVDGGRVRDEYDMDMLGGCNGEAVPYCPKDEVWIERGISDQDALIEHEITEAKLMAAGEDYHMAHLQAEEAEAAYAKRHPKA